MNYKQPLELTGLIANLDTFFREHLSPFWASVVEGLLILLVIVALYAVLALILIYVERKITGFFQSRLGPNRVGKYGSIQSIADMIKILIKEIIHINRADRFLYYVAPFFVIGSSLLAFGAIPFGKGLQVVDFKMGCFTSSPSPPLGCWACCWPAGRATTSTPCSAPCEVGRKPSATSSPLLFR